jgi:hypothetical protein
MQLRLEGLGHGREHRFLRDLRVAVREPIRIVSIAAGNSAATVLTDERE